MADSILLVDADANFRRALRVALTLEGIRVGEAASLAEATAALDESHWDLALIDLLLPLAEGRLALELASQRGIPAIACSTHPELLAPLEGKVPVLAKPFTVAALLAAIRPLYRGSSAGPGEARHAAQGSDSPLWAPNRPAPSR